MGNLERLAIGASSIGGIAGIGVFLNKSLSNENIRSKLQANNYEILNKNDQYGNWERILEVYKTIAKQPDSKFKFPDENIDNKEKLQKECEKVFKKRVGEDSESNNYFVKAKRWCTVPTVVSKVLEKERTILDTDPKKEDADQKEWDKKIQAYTSKDNKDTIKDLDFEKKPITKIEKQHREKIKAECLKLNTKQSYEEGYEDAIKNSTNWCSIEKKATVNK